MSILQKFNKKERVILLCIALLFVAMIVFEFVPIRYSDDAVFHQLLSDTVPLIFGSTAALLLLFVSKTNGLLCRPKKWIFALPALLIAVNNFPFYTYFSGQGQIVHDAWYCWLFFALYCLLTGVYEECLFRGVLFPLIAQSFSQNKRGLILSIVLSSLLFGLSHLFNLTVGADPLGTLLQVVYSTLIGGLCAFLLIKTKSLLFPILTHTVYNFCGLLLPTLGVGTWANLPSILMMFIPAILVGIFYVYHLVKYSEFERMQLYRKFNA